MGTKNDKLITIFSNSWHVVTLKIRKFIQTISNQISIGWTAEKLKVLSWNVTRKRVARRWNLYALWTMSCCTRTIRRKLAHEHPVCEEVLDWGFPIALRSRWFDGEQSPVEITHPAYPGIRPSSRSGQNYKKGSWHRQMPSIIPDLQMKIAPK